MDSNYKYPEKPMSNVSGQSRLTPILPPIAPGTPESGKTTVDSFKSLMPPVVKVKLVRRVNASRIVIESTCDVAEIITRFVKDLDREHFVILMLDVTNRVLGIHTVSIGDLESSRVSPREVFKAAILTNAASIVLGHNHPSGDLTPSLDDMKVTQMLTEAGKLLDIRVLDHVIVGEAGQYASLRMMGSVA